MIIAIGQNGWCYYVEFKRQGCTPCEQTTGKGQKMERENTRCKDTGKASTAGKTRPFLEPNPLVAELKAALWDLNSGNTGDSLRNCQELLDRCVDELTRLENTVINNEYTAYLNEQSHEPSWDETLTITYQGHGAHQSASLTLQPIIMDDSFFEWLSHAFSSLGLMTAGDRIKGLVGDMEHGN